MVSFAGLSAPFIVSGNVLSVNLSSFKSVQPSTLLEVRLTLFGIFALTTTQAAIDLFALKVGGGVNGCKLPTCRIAYY